MSEVVREEVLRESEFSFGDRTVKLLFCMEGKSLFFSIESYLNSFLIDKRTFYSSDVWAAFQFLSDCLMPDSTEYSSEVEQ